MRSRMSRSTAVSATVTNVRSGFCRMSRSRRKCSSAMASVASHQESAASTQLRSSASEPSRSEALHSGPNDPVEAEPALTRDSPRSSPPDSRPFGIPQRLAGDLEPDPLAEDLDLAPRPDRRLLGRNVREGDRLLDREPVAAARHPPDDRAIDPDRLVAERHRSRVVEDQAAQPFPRPALASGDERL